MTQHVVVPLHGGLHLLLHHQLASSTIASTIVLPVEILTVLIVDGVGQSKGGAQPGIGHVSGSTGRVQLVRLCQLLVVR